MLLSSVSLSLSAAGLVTMLAIYTRSLAFPLLPFCRLVY